ncbi:MAG: hypothetical protein H0U57_03475 [Tatlockia sp.]|nr:hypothetical protein [Tatlockia sp.]
MTKKIFFLTGASGAGKTLLIEQLTKKYVNKNWGFFHFDSIGIPSVEVMCKEHGSPSKWQEVITLQWLDRLIHQEESECMFFEGQVNLEFIQKGFEQHHFTDYKIILIDCSDDEMVYRLTHKRDQPELLTPEMSNWLKFLRQQANELGVPIIDTTNLSPAGVIAEFEKVIHTELNELNKEEYSKLRL